jgi:hypothetical protein
MELIMAIDESTTSYAPAVPFTISEGEMHAIFEDICDAYYIFSYLEYPKENSAIASFFVALLQLKSIYCEIVAGVANECINTYYAPLSETPKLIQKGLHELYVAGYPALTFDFVEVVEKLLNIARGIILESLKKHSLEKGHHEARKLYLERFSTEIAAYLQKFRNEEGNRCARKIRENLNPKK